VLKASRARYPFVERAFADGGYAGRLVNWAKAKVHIVVEIVKRNPAAAGFEVLKRRWVVERTFAWIVKNRRFVRDDEQLTAVAETLITTCSMPLMARRSSTRGLPHVFVGRCGRMRAICASVSQNRNPSALSFVSRERMARPVCKGDFRLALVSLLQRIRSRDSPAKMEIRAARSS
jgi:hypothetical protein